MVQTRNLMKLETAQTMDERCTFGRVFKECKRQEEEVFTQFNDKKNAGGSFLKWLQRRHNAEYMAIVRDKNTRNRSSYFGDDDSEDYEADEEEEEDDDDDGFETHDSRGKTPAERWKSWIKGKTRPAWLTDSRATDTLNEHLPDDSVLRECENGDIWRLSKPRRQHCVDLWTSEWLDHSSHFLADAMKKYLELVDQMNELNQASRLRILRSAKIVGMTTTGCAQNQELVHALAPKVVVCEEAGEVLEAHLLSCITPGIQQLIQIGDHLQLRPLVTEYKLSASARRGFNLDISLFERLVRDRLALYRDNIDLMRRRGVLVTLQTQRRMRPAIADLVRFTLYPTLQDSPVVEAYPNVKGFRDNVWFFDHDHAETSDESSKTNKFEAEMLVELVAYALKQGYAGDEIAVLTPYLGQLRLIRRLLGLKSMRVALEERDAEALALLDDAQGNNHEEEEDEEEDETKLAAKTTQVGSVSMQQIVRLSTVDNFQGDEATLVFISTVRCNKDNNSGFLKTPNRINVMLSRAKHGMVVLGSSRTVRHENKADMFLKVLDILDERASIGQNEIVLTCQRHGTPTRVTCAMDIRNLTPDGGCLEPCQARLPCGHACPKMCHFDDPSHELVQCLEPCDRQIDTCGHFCHQRCSAACVCDHVYDEQTLPCGHVVKNVSCVKWQKLMVQPCTRLVHVEMAVCGHVAMLPCPEARQIQAMGANAIHTLTMQQVYQCGHKCGGVREGCGHTCTRPCGQCLEATENAPTPRALQQMVAQAKQTHAGACQQECDRAMACGHYCAAVCHPTGQCPPCDKPCENKCSHSVCESKCSDVCASCSQACGWHCPHTNTTCPLPCGSPCIQLPCTKRCEKKLADCGHQCPGLCGEPCLSSAYCRECGPAVAHYGEIVDLLLYSTLGDHDPTESPLIRLGCGHALTVETLDGVMDISQFYTQSTSGNGSGEVSFTSARPLEPKRDWTAQFKCPHCRFLIVGGVNRYGRVLKYTQTRNGELKFLQEVRTSVRESQTFCATQAAQLSDETAVVTSSTAKAVAQSVRKHYNQWKTRVRLPTPTQELMTKELSRLDRLKLEAKTLNLAAYRQVIMKQSLIQVRLELLRVYALWMQATAACDEDQVRTAVRAKAWTQAFQELMKRERELLTLCNESQSQQSKWEARVAGVKLRCWFVVASSRHCEDKVLIDSVKAAIQDQYQDMQQQETSSSRTNEVASLAPLVDQVFRPATFYQQMTPEEKRSVQQAMGYDKDTLGFSFGGYGGHWYQCPNGHPYVITECGGAMEQSTCPECQAPIGGGDHRTVAGNTSAQAYFEQA